MHCGANAVCQKGECVCLRGYTGPTCRSPPGFNDEDLDPDHDTLPSPPPSLLFPLSLRIAIAVGAIMAIVVVAFRMAHDRRRRSAGWIRIDEGIEDDTTCL